MSTLPDAVQLGESGSAFWTPLRRYRLRSIGSIALVFSALMELIGLLSVGWHPADAVFILLVGFPAGLLIGVLEVGVFPRFLARQRLPVAVTVAALLHLAGLVLFLELLMAVVRRVAPQLDSGSIAASLQWLNWSRVGTQDFNQLLLAYGVGTLGTIFLHQMVRKIGPRVFWSFLTGHYYHPVPEDRIFMFLDLKDSTSLAERLGNSAYSRFISDCFYDMGAAILAARGEVYQYVGDEVVITWLTRYGLPEGRCLHCFFAIQRQFECHRARYLQRYGAVPEFKAGVHGGWVTATQVGDIKSEIAYHGDVVNTAARIQAECNAFGCQLLVSAELCTRLGLVPGLVTREVGKVHLRGKKREVELVEVRLGTAGLA